MSDPLITICVVNYNSSEFVGNLLYSLKVLTHNPFKVIIRDNNSKLKDFNNLSDLIDKNGYTNVELYRVETEKRGSIAHGEALNELTKKIDTTYGVVADADTVFLIKNWDEILINKMGKAISIYGTQADRNGGKPEDFPLMFICFFANEVFQRLNIDFRPGDQRKLQDTGWELREKYLANGLGSGLLYDFNTRLSKSGPFARVICSEYYLSPTGTGTIFASHFGRGSSPKSKSLIRIKNPASLLSRVINYILIYPNVIKWKYDKMRWLRICRVIIDSQTNEKSRQI